MCPPAMEDKAAQAELRRIGAAIRAARHETELSQERFAELAGIDRTYVGRIENGQVNLSWQIFSRVARALMVKPSDIIRRAGL